MCLFVGQGGGDRGLGEGVIPNPPIATTPVTFQFFVQVAFTIKELREMTKLPGCKAVCDPEDFGTIQEKIAGMLILYLNQEVKMLPLRLSEKPFFFPNHLNPIFFHIILHQILYNFTSIPNEELWYLSRSLG